MQPKATDRAHALRMLNEAHAFPCVFVFKAIGINDAAFPASLAQAAVVVAGPKAQPSLQLRESKHGRHVAVTMHLQVRSAEEVLAIYGALGTVSGLHMLL